MCKDKLPALLNEFRNERMLCVVKFDKKTCLDGRKHGGVARHVNYSCDPNFYAAKWSVKGCFRLGIFAQCNMKLGEKLVLDCQWEKYFSRSFTMFILRSPNCRGSLCKKEQTSSKSNEHDAKVCETLVSNEDAAAEDDDVDDFPHDKHDQMPKSVLASSLLKPRLAQMTRK